MADRSVVLTTAGSPDEARRLARALVEARLAACAQLVPIDSVYRWEGEVREDREVLLVIKTSTDRYAEVEALVRELHSYEVPEVVRLDVAEGLPEYLDWIGDSVSPRTDQPPST